MFRFRMSNTLVGGLNLLTLLVCLAAMGGSAYIHAYRAHATHCQRVLLYPLLFGGAFVFFLSFLAILGSLCRVNVALSLYLLVTFFFIVGLAFFTVLAMIATNKKARDKVSDEGFDGNSKEQRIGDFSRLLQQYVINDQNWKDLKSCLVDARVCHNLVIDDNYLVFEHLSSTQFGCCKPPMQCGFTMKNATFWEMPNTGPAVNDSDCKTWNNRYDKLCYDCNSCKGGVLADIRNQWRHLTIFNICVLILVTTLYVLGCYAIRNNRSDSKRKYKRYGA